LRAVFCVGEVRVDESQPGLGERIVVHEITAENFEVKRA
jgi:hypothetical protein